MTRHDVAVLTLRGFALYVWFQALELFTTGVMTVFLYSTSAMGHGARLLAILAPAFIFVAVGCFLFIRSRELASWLLPLPSDERTDALPPHPLAAASVAFGVVGAAFCLNALPKVISFGITYAQMEDKGAMHERFHWDIPEITGTAIQFILGFVLFLKSRTFATAWSRKQETKPQPV